MQSAHKTTFSPEEQDTPAMTPQQRHFRRGGLGTYKELCVGDASWLSLLGYESYNLLAANTPGILGFGLRTLSLPLLTKRFGKGSVLGRGVALRQPKDLSIGKKVIIDDGVVLDIRSRDEQAASIEIDDYAFVGRNSIIAAKGASIRLGEAANISSHCRIASETSVEIGKSVLIAAYVYIGPGNHQVDENGHPIIEEEMIKKGGVSIGEHAWIGTRATILDGVRIGARAIVGAHSLVRRDVPDGAVVAGVPAKIISQP